MSLLSLKEKNVIIIIALLFNVYRRKILTFPCNYFAINLIAFSSCVLYLVLGKITLLYAVFANFAIYFLLHFNFTKIKIVFLSIIVNGISKCYSKFEGNIFEISTCYKEGNLWVVSALMLLMPLSTKCTKY